MSVATEQTWQEIEAAGGTMPEVAERLIRAIAPNDFPPGLVLYILCSSEIDSRLIVDNCGGWTTPLADLYYRQALERKNRWRGRGPTMVVCDVPAVSPQRFTECAIHEFAHILLDLDSPFSESLDDCPELEELAKPELAAEAAQKASAPITHSATKPRWHNHECDFIRVASHLLFRARRIGMYTTPKAINFGGHLYGLSSGDKYFHALSGELVKCEAMTIADILKTSPPQVFTDLWTRDTE